MNSVTRAKSAIKPATTPLVSKILKGGEDLSQVEAVSWGREHEDIAMKAFHVTEAINHGENQLQNCGLYIDPKKPYTLFFIKQPVNKQLDLGRPKNKQFTGSAG